MARALCLCALLGVSSVNGVSIVLNDKADKIVRKEVTRSIVQAKPENLQKAVTECNRIWHLQAEGSDACDTGAGGPEAITYEGDCKTAAAALGLTVAPDADYFLSTHDYNPLPYPKGCFLYKNDTDAALDNKVRFNPSVPNATDGYHGQKICASNKHIKDVDTATGTDPSTYCADHTGTAAIDDYEDCWNAARCVSGGGFCKITSLAANDTTFIRSDLPKGCFQDKNDCWGFNFISDTTSPSVTDGLTQRTVDVVPTGVSPDLEAEPKVPVKSVCTIPQDSAPTPAPSSF